MFHLLSMADLAMIGMMPNRRLSMPELPEVETIKNTLIPIVKGRKILSVDILRDSLVHSNTTIFKKELVNETFLDVTRKGKYLFFHLTNEKVILCHFAMEGRFYIFNENEKNSFFARVVFHLDDNRKLIYDDSRCFGVLKLAHETTYLKEKEVASLGPEPFEIINVDFLLDACKNTTIPIKTSIMTQSLISGIGNIYADETLYACSINPLTPSNKISKLQWEDIVSNSKKILLKAISLGGSTIKSYESTNGVHGRFQINLQAYGRYGEKCPKCGTPFRFIKIGGRGTTYCPTCQKKINNPLKVAIVGKIASGKSSVLNLFKNEDCFAISSDEIVSILYTKPEVVEKINSMFNLCFLSYIDKNELRNYLLNNPSKKRELEEFIHPLVYKYMDKMFKSSKKNILVAEVPLLFESGKENNFDYIIYVDTNDQNRIERIKERNPNSNSDLLTIYNSKVLDKNKEKADFIIENNANLLALGEKVREIFNILLTRLS